MQRILKEGYAMARALLGEHCDQLTKLANALMEDEQLDRPKFEALLQPERGCSEDSFDESMCHNALPEHVHTLTQGGMLWLTQVRVALPEFFCQGT